MVNDRFIRNAAAACVVGGLIATVGAIVTATVPASVPATQLSYPYTPTVFRMTELTWTLAHLLMFIGTIGLARSGAIGAAGGGRVGLRIALVGMALIVPAELAFAFVPTVDADSATAAVLETAIGMATLLAGIGFTIAGVAVLKAGVWTGWERFAPLLCGAFVLVVLIPVITVLPDLFLWPIAGWSACFIALGAAIHNQDVRRPQQLAGHL